MSSTHQTVAMKEAHVGVALVCAKAKEPYVVFDNGLQLPILGWLDENHEEIDEDDECFCEDVEYYEFGDDEHGYGIGYYAAYHMPSYLDH